MATAEQIAELRLLIAESGSDIYTDTILGSMIDARSGDLNGAAYDVWIQKAAAAAELVDISEGGSSRKMGDIYEQALNMARHFGSVVPGGVEPDAPKYPRLSKLRRP